MVTSRGCTLISNRAFIRQHRTWCYFNQNVLRTQMALPNGERACYTVTSKDFLSYPTVVMAHQIRLQTLVRRRHCVRLQLAGKGGEGTMDAGPSHSRPVYSRACSRDSSTHQRVWSLS